MHAPIRPVLRAPSAIIDLDDTARPPGGAGPATVERSSGFRKTGPSSTPRVGGTSSYSAILAQVKSAGLLRRRYGFYWTLFAVLVLATAGCWVAFALLGASWWQLLVAAALGVLFTQFAFLSHEAAHRQVFESRAWNDRAGRFLGTFLVGLSYSWWMNKHTRHHGNPNTVGKDPDIEPDTIRFLPEDVSAVRNRAAKLFYRHQGWLFFPLLTLEGVNLHWLAIRSVVSGVGTRAGRRDRAIEGALLLARFGLLLGVVFTFLPFGMACAFLGV